MKREARPIQKKIYLSKTQVEAIEKWRGKQRPLLTFATACSLLIMWGLENPDKVAITIKK